MDIDKKLAMELGFPKSEYTSIELERRWLCRKLPKDLIRQTELITDLYVTDTRLRLREARPVDGGTPMLRLSRKADVNSHTRLITSIYLPEDEFAILASSLSGVRLKKLRHRLNSPSGVKLLVDEFQEELSGLLIVEAEFKTLEELRIFQNPDFVGREITDEPCFTGGSLIKNGLPNNYSSG